MMKRHLKHNSFQEPFQDTNSFVPSSPSLEQPQEMDFIPFVLGVEWALTYEVVFHSMFQLSSRLDPTLLAETVRVLLSRHDILRARVTVEQEQVQLALPPVSESVPLTFISLSSLPKSTWKAVLTQIGIETYHEISRGEEHLLRFLYFDGGGNEPDLLMTFIHHAISDVFSNHILLEDFKTIYSSLAQNKDHVLSLSKPTSFKVFAEQLISYVQANRQQELSYWSSLPWDQLRPLPKAERKEAAARTDERQIVTVSLSVEETKLLLRVAPRCDFSVIEVLLTTLGLTVAEWIGDPRVAIITLDFGRSLFRDLLGGINLSQTVGSIAVNRVLFLHMGDTHEPFVALKAVRGQLRTIPHQGIGLHLLQAASRDKELSKQIEQSMFKPCQAFLNYMGQLDTGFSHNSVLQPAEEEYSDVQSLIPIMQPLPEDTGHRTFDCVAEIHQGQFWFHLESAPESNHTYDMVEEKAQNFLRNIRNILSALTNEQKISNENSELRL